MVQEGKLLLSSLVLWQELSRLLISFTALKVRVKLETPKAVKSFLYHLKKGEAGSCQTTQQPK